MQSRLISKRTRERFREHNLRSDKKLMVSSPHFNQGRLSWLFRCQDPCCDWLGWIPKDEAIELFREKTKV